MDRRDKTLLLILLLISAGAILIWRVHNSTNLIVSSRSVHAAGVAMDLGADFNKPLDGAYPIISAVRAHNEPMVKKLLASKVNVNVMDGLSATPLIWAAEDSQNDIAQELIAAGAEVTLSTMRGLPP